MSCVVWFISAVFEKRPTLIELKRQLISGAKGVDRSFFHVITQKSCNVVVNCIVHY